MAKRIIPDIIHDQNIAKLPCEATVRDAARLIKDRGIGAVLVVAGDRLEGIVTKRDLIDRVVAPGLDADQVLVSQVMTAEPDTIAPDATAMDALHTMYFGGYRHLPVVDKGRIVGLVSRHDIFGEDKARLDEEKHLAEIMG
jgi:CBS domain-containing protein